MADDYSDLIKQMVSGAQAQVVGNVNANPDQAARAIDLSSATGVPAPVINNNIEQFETQHKAALGSQLIQGNPQLQSYVNSNPMAAKVSSDDFGQLDAVSQATRKLTNPSPLSQIFTGFKKALDSYNDSSVLEAENITPSTPIVASTRAAAAGFAEGFDAQGFLQESQDRTAAYAGANPAVQSVASALNLIPTGASAFSHVFRGLVGGASAGIAQLYQSVTGNEQSAESLQRDLNPLFQMAMVAGGTEGTAVPPELDAITKAVRTADRAAPYLKAGREPPVGLDPVIDEAKAAQAKDDSESLAQATAEAAKSATRERSPDMFRNFIAQHVGDQTIGISGDAVQELYGNKPPAPDDGLLGFVPDIGSQLLRSAATGADVQIPLADWLAKVEPDVAKQLQDSVRFRPDGMTVEEAGGPKAAEAEPSGAEPAPESQSLVVARKMEDGTVRYGQPNQIHADLVDEDEYNREPYFPPATDSMGFAKPGGKFMSRDEALDFVKKNEPERARDAHTPTGLEAGKYNTAKPVVDPAVQDLRQATALNNTGVPEPEVPTSREAEPRPQSGEADQVKLFEKANAIGMNQVQYKRYQDLIGKQQDADAAAVQARAVRAEAKRQTPEWKANRKDMLGQVTQEVSEQPQYLADWALRENAAPKIGAEYLTDEQKAMLPKYAWNQTSAWAPDDVARLVGHDTGDGLVQDLMGLESDRQSQGLYPAQHLSKIINDETDRRMEAKHGDLQENILDSAKEQVLSQTQLDILHAETEALAGGQLPFTKEQLRDGAADAVRSTSMDSISSDAMLATAGRAGRATEDALLKGDAAEAFKQRQRQYNAMLQAKEALRIEKAKAQFDRLAKQYQKREVTGASQEYTNQIHGILLRLGQGVRRSVQDIQDSVAKDGYDGLAGFVRSKEGGLRSLHVPDFLLDDQFRKPVGQLTGDEFLQVNDAMKALAFNSRDELKVTRAGEKADLDATITEMVNQIKSLGPPKSYPLDRSLSSFKERAESFGWSMLNMEAMLNRFDKDDPAGVFNQTLIRVYTEAANYKERLVKQFQSRIASEVGKIPDMDKAVKNDLFIDPITRVPFQMTRRNVLGILQNVGNSSNLRKLAGGYNLDPTIVMKWLENNTTKEDWDRASKIGKIFNDIFDMADNMSHNVSGVGIQKLPLEPVTSKFGTYDGWYNPVQYDAIRPGTSKKLLGPDALEREGYYRADTPQGYTKGRTGYVAPIELNLDVIPTRMRQMLHDIAMRPALLQLSKFFYNTDFRKAIINHYGDHQAEQLIPFLRDVANSPNFRSRAAQIGTGALNEFSSNMVGTLVGMNPGTVLKHGVTALAKNLIGQPVGFTQELATLLKADPETGNTNWQMAMEKSDELNRRMHNWQDLIANHAQELSLQTSGPASLWKDVRSVAQYAGSFPISAFDMMSSVPAWLATYKGAIADGIDEGQAKFMADRVVRQTHGSSIITNKPELTRNASGIGKTFSTLYNFFSENLQQQYKAAWMIKDAYGMAKEGSLDQALAKVPKIAATIFTSTILPALIEEAVTPATNQKHESWGRFAATTLATGATSSMIGIRDLASSIINSRDPESGFLGTMEKTVADPIKDLIPDRQGRVKAFTPATAGKFLKHMTVLGGLATGLTNAQEGKSAEFIWNYFHNREHPQGPWQVMTGLRYGATKGHSKSFDDWIKQAVPK